MSLFPTNPPTVKPDTGSEDIGYTITNSKTILIISIIIAALSFIPLIYFIYRAITGYSKFSDMFTGMENNIIIICTFIFIASLSSFMVEVLYNKDNVDDNIKLYRNRINERFIYSFTGLIFFWWLFFRLSGYQDLSYSALTWSWMYFGSLSMILILSIFIISSGSEFFGGKNNNPGIVIGSILIFFSLLIGISAIYNTDYRIILGIFSFLILVSGILLIIFGNEFFNINRPGFTIGIVMIIYSIALALFGIRTDNQQNKAILYIISFILLIIALILIFSSSNIPKSDFTLPYNNIWTIPDNYISEPIVSNKTKINWNNTNNVQLNFMIDLGELSNTEDLISCSDSWIIKYNSDQQTIELHTTGKVLSYPLTNNIETYNISNISTNNCNNNCNSMCLSTNTPLMCDSECNYAKCLGVMPTATQLNVIGLTISFQNEGLVTIYNNNSSNRYTISEYIKNLILPNDWNSVIEVNREGPIRNFIIAQEEESSFGTLGLGYKLIIILFISIIVYIIFTLLIYPRSREFLLGTKQFSNDKFWFGNIYNSIFE